MSVLIRGMKTPINCTYCPCADDASYYCMAAHEFIPHEFIPMIGIPKFCPIIEIPAHGHLVDIDEVYRVLTEYYHHTTDLQHKALREALSRVPIIVEGEEE